MITAAFLKPAFLAAAVLAFIIGALIYPLREAKLLSDSVFWGSYGAFSHALLFALLWSFPFTSRRVAKTGSFIILAICTTFEIAQHPNVAEIIRAWEIPFLAGYASLGIFDYYDIGAGFLGVILSYAAVCVCVRAHGEK